MSWDEKVIITQNSKANHNDYFLFPFNKLVKNIFETKLNVNLTKEDIYPFVFSVQTLQGNYVYCTDPLVIFLRPLKDTHGKQRQLCSHPESAVGS